MKKLLPGMLMLASIVPATAAADNHTAVQEEMPVDASAPVVVEERVIVKEKSRPFLDNVDWMLMASGFYMFNAHRVSGPYNSMGYPYTNYHGFGLNFVGADASYTGDKWGMTVNLRFGTGAGGVFTPTFLRDPNDDTSGIGQGGLSPIAPVKQAYVSWMPCEKLTLDMGFFDTIFGAEVADEWENVNYSRGALYFLRQPFNHMGLRVGYAASEKVGLSFIVANGGVYGGEPVDANQVPSFGWQVSLAPAEDFALVVGGIHGANGTNGNKDWEHLIDVVATYNHNDLALIFNTDITISPDGPNTGTELEVLYGFSLAVLYAINEKWSAGLRGEFLDGNNNASAGYLATVTPTIRYSPVEFLVFTLEPRIEFTENNTFFSRDSPTTPAGAITPDKKVFFGAIVGASAKIGN